MPELIYSISPLVTSDELNSLFAVSWPDHIDCDFLPILSRSLLCVCTYEELRLAGFVNVAWDGGTHGFIVDTTVHPDFRRCGVGLKLVRTAVEAARAWGLHWLHVDYEPHLKDFYEQCGFSPTEAGLMRLNP